MRRSAASTARATPLPPAKTHAIYCASRREPVYRRRRTVVLFPTFQLFLVPVFLIGFAGGLFPAPPSAPDFILPHMILETGLPALVVGVFCAGALSASMSTGDALLHAAASVAVEDGLRPVRRLDDAQQRRLMRVLVVAIGGVAYYFAIVQQQTLVWLLLTAYGLVCQLAPPVYAALYWRRGDHARRSGRPLGRDRRQRLLLRPPRPAPLRSPRGRPGGHAERRRARDREPPGPAPGLRPRQRLRGRARRRAGRGAGPVRRGIARAELAVKP